MMVEENIRSALQGVRFAPPGWTDPVGRVSRGVRRRRRRRAAAWGSGLSIVAILAGGIVAGQFQDYRADVVASSEPAPWLDQPVSPPSLAHRSPRPSAPECEPKDVGNRGWIVQQGGDKPPSTIRIAVPNEASTRCTLIGFPKITGIDRKTGRVAALPQEIDSERPSGDTIQYPATIDPGESASVEVQIQTTCATNGEEVGQYRKLSVKIGDRDIPFGGKSEFRLCSVSVGEWGVQPPLLNARAQLATMRVIGEAHRGRPLEYVVTILNPSGEELSLRPCPVYKQSLGDGGRYYRLNCRVRSLEPHKKLEFLMRIHVPSNAPLGSMPLHWMGVMVDGEVAIANIATDGLVIQVRP